MKQSNKGFKLPNISTLAGTSLPNYVHVLKNKPVEPKYYSKIIITALIIALASPFRWHERFRYHSKLKKYHLPRPPLFILGHWRSGTTHLHNVLSQDPQAAYVTTFQSLFPEHLSHKWLFKNFMRAVMPKKRPSDNVLLSVDFPQEDEFALGNLHPYCYYHFFHFPKLYAEYYQKFARFEGASPKVMATWKKKYEQLIQKAHLNTGGQQAILKNPVNTARIPWLLDLFPEARFVHIYRNPVIVYLSTKKFFLSLMPTLQFQEISETEICNMILDVYEWMYRDFLQERPLIPEGQFHEIQFEAFERSPLDHMAALYQKFDLPHWPQAQVAMEAYLKAQVNYKKNTYSISQEELEAVQTRWGFSLKTWGYQLPEGLKVT